MKNSSRFALVLAICLMLVATAACRTRTKKKAVTPETTPVTDTAPSIDPTTSTAEPVDDRRDDFVAEDAVTTEDLPADLDELNRQASERGWIRDAFFEYDASTLSSDAQEALTTTATWLKSHRQYNLLIEGHCDNRGTAQYNLALGDRRANTAKDYLVTLGVDASRVRTVSYGEERPFDEGSSEDAHRSNRRAHLVLTGR